MKIKNSPYLFFLLIVLFACAEDDEFVTLQANFEFPDRLLVNDVFTLGEVTSGGAGYLWDFGNGQTSTEKFPRVSYMNPGVYTVSLTVISTGQGRNSFQRKVSVGQYEAFRIDLLEVNDAFRDLDMDMYFTVNQIQSPRWGDWIVPEEKEIYRSEVISGFNSNSLPLSFNFEGIPLGGYGYSFEGNPVVRFFNAQTDEVIAANGFSIRGQHFGWKHQFGPNRQSGDFIATSSAGGRINYFYQAIYP
jgi:PKD repeat protein